MNRNRWYGTVTLVIGALLITSPASASADDQACCLPDGVCIVMPADECIAIGGTLMGALTCEDVVCREPADYRFEFSLDIGSDTELSDPFMDGDEGFDPGDVYWWQGPPVNPPGRDGFKDDRFIFNFDPMPDPPDPGYTTRVPVGEGHIEMYYEYFDLDGHDQLDIDIVERQWFSVTHPPEAPIPYFDSMCIYKIDFLMVSFDDDMGPGWPAFDVPVTQPSPAGVSSYGSSAGMDEIMGINLMAGGPPPYPVGLIYPIADELTVHMSLAPNPDNDERADDDVDSLDIVRSQEECPFWYFSPDSEAHLGLDPGGIYQVMPGGAPIQVIDEFMHLGIPEETDIDAFEFVWLENPQEPDGMLYLALAYSVDDDDPLTPWDESGGLFPNVIYGSFMTGWSFQVTWEDMIWDDIDAITCWERPLEPEPQFGACCLGDCACNVMTQVDCNNAGGTWAGLGTDCSDYNGDGIADACFTCLGDFNCDGVVNLSDLATLLSNYGATTGVTYRDGDMDGDGDVDLADLAALLAVYGTTC